MFSKIISGSIHGIHCVLTQVEVDIAKTMPAFDMVGMLSGEVKDVTITLLIQSRIGRKLQISRFQSKIRGIPQF